MYEPQFTWPEGHKKKGRVFIMSGKGNVVVGQSGGPTAVINASLAGVFKTALDRGFDHVYGMRYGIQGFIDGQYCDLADYIKNNLDLELLKKTPSAFLGTCRYKLPAIHEDKALYEKIFGIPGMGNLLLNSIVVQDFPVVQAVLLIIAILTVICNLLSDIVIAILDPRIRIAIGGGDK